MFDNLCDYIKDELKEMDRKIASGGKLSASELEYGDKLAHFKKSLLTNEAMEEGASYGSGRHVYNDRSYDDGRMMDRSAARGRNARRDSMGRYASRRSYDDDMMSELYELMEKSPDGKKRQKFQEFIAELEEM